MNTQQGKETPQTRKGIAMKMTYVDALNTAMDALRTAYTADNETVMKAVEKLSAIRDTYQRRADERAPLSDKAKAIRKAQTAERRAALVARVAPILRAHLSQPITAKELFEAVKDEIPDFSPAKVQNVLLREMRDELNIVEAKGKANTYQLKA